MPAEPGSSLPSTAAGSKGQNQPHSDGSCLATPAPSTFPPPCPDSRLQRLRAAPSAPGLPCCGHVACRFLRKTEEHRAPIPPQHKLLRPWASPSPAGDVVSPWATRGWARNCCSPRVPGVSEGWVSEGRARAAQPGRAGGHRHGSLHPQLNQKQMATGRVAGGLSQGPRSSLERFFGQLWRQTWGCMGRGQEARRKEEAAAKRGTLDPSPAARLLPQRPEESRGECRREAGGLGRCQAALPGPVGCLRPAKSERGASSRASQPHREAQGRAGAAQEPS